MLENPDHISKNILTRGLDAGTAYEILSIDIADVDVGENIGAKLQIDQANADKQIAQAKAEERRAMAVALEQEMRARVVEAEAEVPRAMAEAFRQGNLGIMDYYRMKNIQADSSMRESIADQGDGGAVGGRPPISSWSSRWSLGRVCMSIESLILVAFLIVLPLLERLVRVLRARIPQRTQNPGTSATSAPCGYSTVDGDATGAPVEATGCRASAPASASVNRESAGRPPRPYRCAGGDRPWRARHLLA